MKTVLSSLPSQLVEAMELFGGGAFCFVNEEVSTKLVRKISSLKQEGFASVVVTMFQSDMQFSFAPLMEEAEKHRLVTDFIILGVSSPEEVQHIKAFSRERFGLHAFQADHLEEAALRLIELL